jgi:hypothetical protein
MSASDQFILHSSSFSLDDSDVEYMLLNDDIEHTMVTVAARNLQDRLRMEDAARIDRPPSLHPTETRPPHFVVKSMILSCA